MSDLKIESITACIVCATSVALKRFTTEVDMDLYRWWCFDVDGRRRREKTDSTKCALTFLEKRESFGFNFFYSIYQFIHMNRVREREGRKRVGRHRDQQFIWIFSHRWVAESVFHVFFFFFCLFFRLFSFCSCISPRFCVLLCQIKRNWPMRKQRGERFPAFKHCANIIFKLIDCDLRKKEQKKKNNNVKKRQKRSTHLNGDARPRRWCVKVSKHWTRTYYVWMNGVCIVHIGNHTAHSIACSQTRNFQ